MPSTVWRSSSISVGRISGRWELIGWALLVPYSPLCSSFSLFLAVFQSLFLVQQSSIIHEAHECYDNNSTQRLKAKDGMVRSFREKVSCGRRCCWRGIGEQTRTMQEDDIRAPILLRTGRLFVLLHVISRLSGGLGLGLFLLAGFNGRAFIGGSLGERHSEELEQFW